MPLMKMSTTVDEDNIGIEIVEKNTKPNSHLVRVCETYQDFLRDCKSFKGRMYQYYVYGEMLDCSIHKENLDDCLLYRKTGNTDHLNKIIEWEQKMITSRNAATKNNISWEFRDSPPADFNSPLPSFLTKDNEKTLFKN